VLKAVEGEVEFYAPGSGARMLTKQFRLERGGRAVVDARAEVAEARAKGAPPAIDPPIRLAEPPPLEEWLRGRKVLTVAQDGSGQFKTIQSALNALEPGQVVQVLDPGPYRETLRLATVPKDTGLFSEKNTVVELPGWESNIGHQLGAVDGFRLSGFRFLAPQRKQFRVLTHWPDSPSGLVIEDCCFDPNAFQDSWRDGTSIDLAYQVLHNPKEPVVVRRCAIYDRHLATFGSHSRAVVLVENNYFHKTSTVYCGSPRLGKLVIRDNVFDAIGPGFVNLEGNATAVELGNNTIVGERTSCKKGVPTGGVTVRNNIVRWGVQFNAEEGAGGKWQQARSWQMDHNCYLEYARNPEPTYPKGATDLVDQAEFLSLDPEAPDYLRLPADSPLGKAGAGGAWPAYIGAFPPARHRRKATGSPACASAGRSSPRSGCRPFAPGPALRGGAPGVFRPGVLGVAGTQLLAHLRIGVLPEAGQVVGDLLRAVVGGQEVQEDGDPAASDLRRVAQAEHFLDAHRQHRRPAHLVAQDDAAAAGHDQALRCLALDRLALRVCQASL
jgi:hypothetical protein